MTRRRSELSSFARMKQFSLASFLVLMTFGAINFSVVSNRASQSDRAMTTLRKREFSVYYHGGGDLGEEMRIGESIRSRLLGPAYFQQPWYISIQADLVPETTWKLSLIHI